MDLAAEITVYDPQAMQNAQKILPKINYAKDPYDAIKGQDALLLITEWPQFRQLDLSRIKKLLKRPIIVDGRNMFDAQKVRQAGFSYFKIGA